MAKESNHDSRGYFKAGTSYWRGKKRGTMSKEHKQKVSESRKGKGGGDRNASKRSEVRAKISAALKGREVPWHNPKEWWKNHPEMRVEFSLAKRRDKNPMWAGGMTPFFLSIRQCFRYRLWRDDVYHRDDFVCQKCGRRGGILHADHIKPFILIILENKIKTVEDALACDELWNINNGQTLCVTCHRKTETHGKTRRFYEKK